ncbi:unnamed protein product [Brassica oleracea var. botrytis]|uniref:(rape) hypothetical protein n=1 Tax=Brassica napus TaxID=3708 RepID=A0A816R5D1_BRANA|nr:unnamed protein product [Brassica napus]
MKFNTKDHPRHFLEKQRYVENKTVCNLCEEEIHSGSTFYCRTCTSHFHESCLAIDEPNVHDHSLFFIRRQTSVVCNVCGTHVCHAIYLSTETAFSYRML